jgi:hypothetical protein
MTSIRLCLLAAVLSLAPLASALAIEVLPMDTPPVDCNDRPNEAAAAEMIDADGSQPVALLAPPAERAESPAGIEAGESVPASARSAPPAAVAPSAPSRAASRWNAFLPGMVR